MKKIPEKKPATESRCFNCNGTGLICDVCGEAEGICKCGAAFSECEHCQGTGK